MLIENEDDDEDETKFDNMSLAGSRDPLIEVVSI